MGLMRFLYLGLQKLIFLKEINICFYWPEEVISAWVCRLCWDIKVRDFRLFSLSFSLGPLYTALSVSCSWSRYISRFLCTRALSFIPFISEYMGSLGLHICSETGKITFPSCFLQSPTGFCPFLFLPCRGALGSLGTSFSSSRAGMQKSPFSFWENQGKGNGRTDRNRCDTNCHFAKWLFTQALLWMHSDTVQMILGLLNNSFPHIYCSRAVPDSFIACRLAHYEKKSK